MRSTPLGTWVLYDELPGVKQLFAAVAALTFPQAGSPDDSWNCPRLRLAPRCRIRVERERVVMSYLGGSEERGEHVDVLPQMVTPSLWNHGFKNPPPYVVVAKTYHVSL